MEGNLFGGGKIQGGERTKVAVTGLNPQKRGGELFQRGGGDGRNRKIRGAWRGWKRDTEVAESQEQMRGQG